MSSSVDPATVVPWQDGLPTLLARHGQEHGTPASAASVRSLEEGRLGGPGAVAEDEEGHVADEVEAGVFELLGAGVDTAPGQGREARNLVAHPEHDTKLSGELGSGQGLDQVEVAEDVAGAGVRGVAFGHDLLCGGSELVDQVEEVFTGGVHYSFPSASIRKWSHLRSKRVWISSSFAPLAAA